MNGGPRRLPSLTSPPAFSWILLGGVLLRVAFAIGAAFLTPPHGLAPFHHDDTDGYLEPAFDLVSFGTFTNRNQPELLRTLAYPLLLQLGVWMGQPEAVTVILQVLLSAVTIAGVFLLARELFADERLALAAAVLYAIEPLSIIYTSQLASETYFTAVLVWALVLLVRHLRTGKAAPLLGAMALLGLGIHVRPIGLYLPFGIVALLSVHAALQRRWKELGPLVTSAALTLAIVAPWVMRNRSLGFNGVASVSVINLYFWDAAALRQARTGASFLETQHAMGHLLDSVYFDLHPEQRAWRLGERLAWQGREGRREVLANLPAYARLHLVGMARVVADPGLFSGLKAFRLYPQIGGMRITVLSNGLVKGIQRLIQMAPAAFLIIGLFTLLLAATWALGVRGAVLHYRDPAVLLLLATIAYFLVISGGPVGEGRFRHPVMPILCVLAAAGRSGLRWPWDRFGGPRPIP